VINIIVYPKKQASVPQMLGQVIQFDDDQIQTEIS
jgi:hypothetical protein